MWTLSKGLNCWIELLLGTWTTLELGPGRQKTLSRTYWHILYDCMHEGWLTNSHKNTHKYRLSLITPHTVITPIPAETDFYTTMIWLSAIGSPLAINIMGMALKFSTSSKYMVTPDTYQIIYITVSPHCVKFPLSCRKQRQLSVNFVLSRFVILFLCKKARHNSNKDNGSFSVYERDNQLFLLFFTTLWSFGIQI